MGVIALFFAFFWEAVRGILVPTSGVIVKLTLTISYRLNSVNFKPVASRIFWKQKKACSQKSTLTVSQ